MSVEFKIEDGVAVITINRPEARNALIAKPRWQSKLR